MDEPLDTETTPTPTSAPDEGAGEPRQLRRTQKHLFGGVAGGVAQRFDIDVNIVRVIFVVLALVYGLGIAIYLAMWVLIPRSNAEDDTPEVIDDPVTTSHRWFRYAVPLGIVILAFVVFATLHHAARLGKGLSLFWLLFLGVLLVVALRSSSSRRFRFRRFVAFVMLAGVSFLILLIGAFLITMQVIGVPLRGGSGTRAWQPLTVAETHHHYYSEFGQTTLDLSRVPFTTGNHYIAASQSVGVLTVEVPSNVTLDVRSHVGLGSITNWVGYERGLHLHTWTAAKEPRLILNLQVGMGTIHIVHEHGVTTN